MRKIISLLLTVVMCISVATSIVVPVSAAYENNNYLYVSNTQYDDGVITYTIGLKKGVTKLTGASLRIKYDVSDLSVVECKYDEAKIPGMYVADPVSGMPGEYAMAYINTSGYSITADSDFFTIKFKAINEARPKTSVSFECVEFITDNNIDDDLKKPAEAVSLGYHEFHTLESPDVTAVDSVDKSLKVSWDEVAGAQSYDIYRKADDDASWEKVASAVSGAEYTDNTIVQGKIYTYSVVANNASGSTETKESTISGMYFGTIEAISATAAEEGINVTWSSLAGAEKYEVLRKLPSESKWNVIATVTGENNCAHLDKTALSGQDYNYSVRAIKGKYTAGLSAPVPTAKYIGKPGVAAVNTPSGIAITVTAVGGGEEYTVCKKENDGAYSVLKTITAAEFTNGKFVFTDAQTTENRSYNYSVQAVAGDIKSAVVELKTAVTKLATPVLDKTQTKNADNGITIGWNSVLGAATYDIYRKAQGETVFSYYASVSGTTYTDKNTENNKLYTYTVAAKDAFNGVGTYNATGVSMKRLNTPTGISTITVSNGVKVSWGAVAGAQSYTVYRKTASDKYFSEVNTVNETSCVDLLSVSGITYYYTVAANSGEYSSAYNLTGVPGMNFGTVTSLKYSLLGNGVKLTWNVLSSANGYRVYRKTASESAFVLIKTITSASTNTFDDTTIPSGINCQYKVEAYNGNCVASMTAPVITAKYLAMPRVDAVNAGEGIIKLSFNSVYGAQKYVIERADGTSTSYKKIAEITTTEYLDKANIVAGMTYTYRVKAVAGTLESYYATDVITKMIAPVIYSAYNEIAGIRVRWNAVPDATSYNVYRRNPGGNWAKLATTPDIEFTDASVISGVIYQYTVEANTPDGPTGYNLEGKECRFIETPDLNYVKNVVGGVQIEWNKVAGATSYRIYRRPAGSNNWLYLGSVSPDTDTFKDVETSSKKSIKSNNYYRYTVRAAYDGTDSKGAPYQIYSRFDYDGLYLKYFGTPDVKSVTNSTNGLTVKWGKVNGATTYRIYRRTSSSGWKLIATVKGNVTSYTDAGVKRASGGSYRYTVRAMFGKQASPYETGLYTKRLVNPTLKSATSSTNGITVNWGTVKGATGYYVYRKTAGSGWKRVATVKGNGNVWYVDKSARKGTTYTYTVRAYYGKVISYYNTKGLSCKDRY